MPGLTARIEALEDAAGMDPTERCPGCGAGFVGATIALVERDGGRQFVCRVCMTERPAPAYRPMVYPAAMRELLEGL